MIIETEGDSKLETTDETALKQADERREKLQLQKLETQRDTIKDDHKENAHEYPWTADAMPRHPYMSDP